MHYGSACPPMGWLYLRLELVDYHWTLRGVCSYTPCVRLLGEEKRSYSNDTVVAFNAASCLLELSCCFLSVRGSLDICLLFTSMVSDHSGSEPAKERGLLHGYCGTFNIGNFGEWDCG